MKMEYLQGPTPNTNREGAGEKLETSFPEATDDWRPDDCHHTARAAHSGDRHSFTSEGAVEVSTIPSKGAGMTPARSKWSLLSNDYFYQLAILRFG